MKKIKLTQNKYALVDDEDFERLNQYKWYAVKGKGLWYASRHTSAKIDKARKVVWMHREVNNTPKEMETDHIDGNGLNNQRKNLRACVHAQNGMNKGKNRSNTSGFKGVTQSSINRWKSQITVDNKNLYLGSFNSKLKAYKAYCEACLKYHKQYGRTK